MEKRREVDAMATKPQKGTVRILHKRRLKSLKKDCYDMRVAIYARVSTCRQDCAMQVEQ